MTRQYTCDGAYESERSIQYKTLFYTFCEGICVDDTYNMHNKSHVVDAMLELMVKNYDILK